jgi:CheY-like chemotaxis protein
MLHTNTAQQLSPSSRATRKPANMLVSFDTPILIVDNDRAIGRSLAEMLTANGFEELRSVRSAPRALAIAAAFLPRIAFIDIGLPDMDAHELARQLARLVPQKALRLIALTDQIEHAGREEARSAGFERFLVKPVTQPEIDKIFGRQST